MKKTCRGCKALEKKLFGFGFYCGLSHSIWVVKEIDGIPIEYKPIEECEKPRTITAYCELSLAKTRKIVKN